jgi:hypothetical protein
MSMQGIAAALQHAQTARERRSPGCQFSPGAPRAAVPDAAQGATPPALQTGLD